MKRDMNARARLLSGWLVLALLTSDAARADAEEDLFMKDVSTVNEGPLHFLPQAPERPVHHHINHITLTDGSLADGWAGLRQCHENLDAVANAQVTYGADRIRALTVVEARGIERAWVEGPSVQLRGVSPGSRLCITAETRALAADGAGRFVLRNGPYMRKFLDGYYPMRVSMAVTLETARLDFADIQPAAQPGFEVWREGRALGYEASFEGELRTVIGFKAGAPQMTTPPRP